MDDDFPHKRPHFSRVKGNEKINRFAFFEDDRGDWFDFKGGFGGYTEDEDRLVGFVVGESDCSRR